jgi:hypothetical protein
MKQKRQCWGTNEEYFIYDPIRQDIIRFIIKGFKYGKKSINEFDVSTPNESIGSISKRYEKLLAPNKVVLCEDHYTRVNVTETIDSIDKALILSAGLLIVSNCAFKSLLFILNFRIISIEILKLLMIFKHLIIIIIN